MPERQHFHNRMQSRYHSGENAAHSDEQVSPIPCIAGSVTGGNSNIIFQVDKVICFPGNNFGVLFFEFYLVEIYYKRNKVFLFTQVEFFS